MSYSAFRQARRRARGVTAGAVVALVMAGALLAAVAGAAGFWFGQHLPMKAPIAPNLTAAVPQPDALFSQALAPGSALACLERPLAGALETGCERALFASAGSVASALAYVDARLAAWRAAGGTGDTSIRAAFAADPFGFVAQALSERGCTPQACADLALFSDSARLSANLSGRLFEVNLGLHAPAWSTPANGPGPLAAAPPSVTPEQPAAAPAPTAPFNSRYDFPSSASIPPVSIMTSEPPSPAPPAADASPQAKPAPARRAQPRERPARDVPVRETPASETPPRAPAAR